jgi:putative glutamine amidotransferase
MEAFRQRSERNRPAERAAWDGAKRRPAIGVSMGHVEFGNRATDATEKAYAQAVVSAGSIPLLVPALPAVPPEEVVERLDGLLLTGGGDVDPRRYGAVPSPQSGGIDEERDSLEISLVRRAVEAGLPTLAICRGCQLLNVALGGTLIQHLPEVSDLAHLVPERRSAIVYDIEVQQGSRLSAIVGSSSLGVNSIHHQAVERTAPELAAVGRADDGVVEAIEHPSLPMLGVQWHPEDLLRNGAHRALFEWLVSTSAGSPFGYSETAAASG